MNQARGQDSGLGIEPCPVRTVPPVPARGYLVPVTVWVHPDRTISARPCQAAVQPRGWLWRPVVVVGLVVAVVATLAVCVVIGLLALVAWVSAHALAVGTGIAAVVMTSLLFLRALARTRNTGPPGGCCR